MEGFLILKDAAFFGEQVGNSGDGGVGSRRGGVGVVDGAVGVEHAVILEAGTLRFGAAFEGFAEALSVGECGGAGGGILSGGHSKGRTDDAAEDRDERDAEVRGRQMRRVRRVGPGGQHRDSDSSLHRRPCRPSVIQARELFEDPAGDTLDYRWRAGRDRVPHNAG